MSSPKKYKTTQNLLASMPFSKLLANPLAKVEINSLKFKTTQNLFASMPISRLVAKPLAMLVITLSNFSQNT